MNSLQKYIGLVKWFYNEARDANYGFVYHPKLGNLFFHEWSLSKNSDIQTVKEISKNNNTPRVLAAAKQFNIGLQTLINFLVSKGFHSSDLKPTAKLSKEMYTVLQSEFREEKKANTTWKIVVIFDLVERFKRHELKGKSLEDLPEIFDHINDKKLPEAKNLKLLTSETDIKFLFEELLLLLHQENQTNEEKIIYIAIEEQINTIIKESKNYKADKGILNHYQSFLNEQLSAQSKINSKGLKEILKIGKVLFPDNYKDISNLVEKNITSEIAHDLWMEEYIYTCQIDFVANLILSSHPRNNSVIFKRCSNDDKLNIFIKAIKKSDELNHKIKFEKIKELLKLVKEFVEEEYNNICNLIQSKVSAEIAHNLWLEKYIDSCQIDYIASILVNSNNETKRRIFERCTEEDKSNIFFKIIYEFEKIDSNFKLTPIKKLLQLAKEFAASHYEKILKAILKICPDYFKLNLWLEDYHSNLDFNCYKLYTITLSPEEQKKFVKKVLKYIHEGKLSLSIAEFTSISVIDFKTSKKAFDIDHYPLDYSTSIILNVISELKAQTSLETLKEKHEAQRRIYDLIIKQIRQPDDILQIKGFFDECEGRCFISIQEETNEQGAIINKQVEYRRDENNKPKLHPICDGRKAISKQTNESGSSEENEIEFWWCANQKCYKPSRHLHNSTEWEKYSLLDFLTILKVNFKEKDLEIYLSLINKANRFLQHLKCRSCGNILRPIGRSNYAFYGVNEFQCSNRECSESEKTPIYITHCLNGNCEQTIDSRDCVKCKPGGFQTDKCGWYVCNYCHSCCSDDAIKGREYILTRTGQKYKCHTKGHRELGIISCNKCGSAMNTNKFNEAEYHEILNWFIQNKDNKEHIIKSGKRNDDKWWFLLKRGNLTQEKFKRKIFKLLNLGFRIPDFQEEKDVYLIPERNNNVKWNSKILICSNPDCANIIDLTKDFEKAFAIERFHSYHFPKESSPF